MKLSIILTSRDKYELLRFAVDSVFRQTFRDWELIIADDASTDLRMEPYLCSLNDMDRVRVFWGKAVTEDYRKAHKMNAVRINAALAMSEGEYISYLGDDNVYLPDRCERMVRALDADKSVGMVVDQVRWVMFDGQESDQDQHRFGYVEPYEPGHKELLAMIAPSNYICTDSVMHRRQRPCCMNWPTDARNHTPVDWRYWCYLVSELKIRVKRVEAVGERAYFPGTWRHGITVKQVLLTRREPLREEDDMTGKTKLKNRRKREERAARKEQAKDKKGKVWCVNVSGKRQQITMPGGGRPITVEKDGRIELRFVKTMSGIMEGFAYDTRVSTPPLRQVLKNKPVSPKKVEYERVEKEQPLRAAVQVKKEEALEPEEDVDVEEAKAVMEVATVQKPKEKLIPPPATKREIVKAAAAPAKSPVDEPAGKVDGIRACACGKVLSARNKSGMCRDCYIKSLKDKE